MIVVDASAAMAWLLGSQSTPAAMTFLVDHFGDAYEAPFVFEWEVKNILLSLNRSGSLSPLEYRETLDRLDVLQIRLASPFAVARIESLATTQGLTLFDAAYLDHALASGGELVSRDRALLAAAQRCSVVVHDIGSGPRA